MESILVALLLFQGLNMPWHAIRYWHDLKGAIIAMRSGYADQLLNLYSRHSIVYSKYVF